MIDFLKNAVSPYHASAYIRQKLKQAGFCELKTQEEWELKNETGYYICPFGTTVIAFYVGKKSDRYALKIAASHTDHPGFRIKENPEMRQGGYVKLNVESYGGAILNTWLDRPLSAAGSVWIKDMESGAGAVQELVDFGRPLFVIPNVSIHMNRELNDGAKLNKQVDMLPLAAIGMSGEFSFRGLIARYLWEKRGMSLDENDILSWDMSIYNAESPVKVGVDEELLMAGGIDNASSEKACLDAIIEAPDKAPDGIAISAFFDHEEVGSRSKNGADSTMLSNIIERIYLALGLDRSGYLSAVMSGEFLSLDAAHATNPNHPEKYDPTSGVELGSGVTIKCSSRQNYCTDGDMTARLLMLAGKNNIACSINYLRSDIPGGSTIGSLLSSQLPMRGADAGIPILAMHSAMETMALSDQLELEKLTKAFLNNLDC